MRSSRSYVATRSERAGFDLPDTAGNDEIGDHRVLGLSRTVRDHGSIAGPARHFDRLQRLGQGPDLVELDQDRVGDALVDAVSEHRRVGDEYVVADQLHAITDTVGQQPPTLPVVFGHPILEQYRRVIADHPLPVVDHLADREAAVLAVQPVAAVDEQLAAGGIDPHRDIGPRSVARRFDRRQQ